jgi:DNA-binding CsgD family transcriptional regulator
LKNKYYLMNSNIEKLQESWAKCSSVISKEETDLKDTNFNDLIASFFCPGPFYYYIFDFPSLSFSYVHPNMGSILGVDTTSFTPYDLMTRLHPEDIDFMGKCEQAAFQFVFQKLPEDKRKSYKITYCIRIKAHESYKLILFQIVMLTSDHTGALGKSFCVHTDISHITTTNNYKISFVGINGEPSYCNLDPKEVTQELYPINILYSNREIEVIKLLAEGFTAMEVGDKISISTQTVRKHVNNILSKSDCNNMSQVVVKCIKEGLI